MALASAVYWHPLALGSPSLDGLLSTEASLETCRDAHFGASDLRSAISGALRQRMEEWLSEMLGNEHVEPAWLR